MFSFALRNVIRQKVRSAATLASIAMGTIGLILAGGFVQDIFIQLGEAIIHSQTGHIQITKTGYREGRTRSPEKFVIEDPEALKRDLKITSPEIDYVMSRLGFSGTLNNGKRDLGIIGEGIEPDAEAKMGTYLHMIHGRPLTGSDLDSAVIGEGVAKSLGLKIGDRATLVVSLAAGAVNTLDVEIVGIFQSFSKDFDARAIRISIDAARTLLDIPGAHVLIAMLHKTNATDATVNAINSKNFKSGLEVRAWNQLSDFYEKTVELYDRQFGVLRLIILVMVLLSVVNSVNLGLFERTREFGTMRALGDTSGQVFRLILAESLCLGGIGAIVGIVLGCIVALSISAVGIPMPPPPNANIGYTALIRLAPISIGVAGLIGFVACVLATVLPAKRAANIDIVDALRHGM